MGVKVSPQESHLPLRIPIQCSVSSGTMTTAPRVVLKISKITSTPPKINWTAAKIPSVVNNLRFPLDKAYILYQVHLLFKNVTRYWTHRMIMKTWTASVDKVTKMARMIGSTKQLGNSSWRHEDLEYWTYPCLVWSIWIQESFSSALTCCGCKV